MNSKTRTQIREIQSKVKSSLTGEKEFINDDAVIEFAIETLYADLRRRKVL